MKMIVILDIDPDVVQAEGDPKGEGLNLGRCVEDIIEASCGHLGIEEITCVIEPDSVPPKDADLGALIRKS
jgi:hypothetical protein